MSEAVALHSHDELFSMHFEPEPAEEDPVETTTAMPDALASDEPDLIDLPAAPASPPRMPNLERCIALRLVYGAGLRRD